MKEVDILKKVISWRKKGHQVAIATVVQTWGSSPRPVGSIMAINDQNEILGSVSGGCIESEVFIKALKVIKTEKPITLSFGISNSQAWGVGLTCGGKVKVFVEKILQ